MTAALTLEQIDARIGELPPLAPAVRELLALLEQEALDHLAMERVIRNDPVLAGRVLRLSNSSFFGFAGRIGSLREACLVLGSRTLRQMVLAAAAVQQIEVDRNLLDVSSLWRHALATSAIARCLAQELDSDPEIAFTAGLLHDLGKLVLAAWFRVEYGEVLRQHAAGGGLMLETERAVLGTDHGLFGEKLARKWCFPDALVVAIGRHHDPAGDRLSDIVHLADVLAHALDRECRTGSYVPPLLAGAWDRLGLGWDRIERLLPVLDREAGKAAQFELV